MAGETPECVTGVGGDPIGSAREAHGGPPQRTGRGGGSTRSFLPSSEGLTAAGAPRMAFLAQGPRACPTSQTPKATASLHPAVSYFRQTLFLCKFLDLSAFGPPERSPAGLVAAASQWSEDVMAALWGTQVCPHGPPGGVRRARCCCLRAGVWGAPPARPLGMAVRRRGASSRSAPAARLSSLRPPWEAGRHVVPSCLEMHLSGNRRIRN